MRKPLRDNALAGVELAQDVLLHVRMVLGHPSSEGCRRPIREAVSAVAVIEPWEIHSELVLVSPEVCERARQLLPERDPDGFLDRPRATISPSSDTADEEPYPESLPLAVLGYTLWRLAGTARAALLTLGAIVAVALLAQLLH
jgi:hypothetical protein